MKAILLLLFTMMPLAVSGQTVDPKAKPTVITSRGAFVALSVSDMKESVKWYSEKLGLRVVTRSPSQDKVAFTLLEGGGLIVELLQHSDALPMSKAAPQVKESFLVHGIFKVGIIVDDLDKVLAMLKARDVNIHLGPFPAKEKQRAFFIIKDNAGNFIQFFQK